MSYVGYTGVANQALTSTGFALGVTANASNGYGNDVGGSGVVDLYSGIEPPFTPLSLFLGGEQGAWYDPSDIATLYQDDLATLRVTAAGQPVGLMLDKSKGLAQGPQLVTNSDFSGGSTAGWIAGPSTLPAIFTVVDGRLRVTTPTGAVSRVWASTSIPTTVGKTYTVSVDVTLSGGTTCTYLIGTSAGTNTGYNRFRNILTPQTFTAVFVAVTSTTFISFRSGDTTAGNYFEIDNVTARLLDGNHAANSGVTPRPTYQVDGSGKAYLLFDGVDDGLSTPVFVPLSDKAQLFLGVTKLSDATTMAVTEFGLSAATNNGTIGLLSPLNDLAANFALGSRGTTFSGWVTSSSIYTPPSTVVVTGLGDIAGSTATLRINGTQVAQSTAAQGTGQYLTNAIYIGRRGASSLAFNGQIYQLILRFGPTLTAGQITNTENWTNAKTGAY